MAKPNGSLQRSAEHGRAGTRDLIAKVKVGAVSRRAFVQRMLALGLTAPIASQMLSVAQAQAKFVYKPTQRGGGGALKLLWWQSPTLLNPHFAIGTKDQEGARIFYEPLPPGTRTEISRQCLLPKSRAAKTAAWQPMVSRSLGRSSAV